MIQIVDCVSLSDTWIRCFITFLTFSIILLLPHSRYWTFSNHSLFVHVLGVFHLSPFCEVIYCTYMRVLLRTWILVIKQFSLDYHAWTEILNSVGCERLSKVFEIYFLSVKCWRSVNIVSRGNCWEDIPKFL